MARGITDKAESDLHWRCASLRLTALRCEVLFSVIAWDFLEVPHEGSTTGGRHASKRAWYAGMSCH